MAAYKCAAVSTTGLRQPKRSDSVPMKKQPMAKPPNHKDKCTDATARDTPCTCIKYGVAHKPAKAKNDPDIPALVKIVGQVSRLPSTCLNPNHTCAHGICAAPLEVGFGVSRTNHPHNTAPISDSTPTSTNTLRQPNICAPCDNGDPAKTEPKLPINIHTPTKVAKRVSSNHTAISLSIAMKVTDTPKPISVRPSKAHEKLGAKPNSTLPAPPITPPKIKIRRGPQVSAKTPVGICITVYT